MSISDDLEDLDTDERENFRFANDQLNRLTEPTVNIAAEEA